VSVGSLSNFEYDSLEDITREVDLVVVGRITDVFVKPVLTGNGESIDNIFGHLAYDDVLKGVPNTTKQGEILVQLWRSGPFETVKANIPDELDLFFLINDAAHLARIGEESRDPEAAAVTYWRPNDQAVIRNIDGYVNVVAKDDIEQEWGPDRFPLHLDGRPFEEVVDQVRTFAGRN
jgi:hypothetical protein